MSEEFFVHFPLNDKQQEFIKEKSDIFINGSLREKFKVCSQVLGYSPTNIEMKGLEDVARQLTGRWFEEDEIEHALENTEIFDNVFLERRDRELPEQSDNNKS